MKRFLIGVVVGVAITAGASWADSYWRGRGPNHGVSCMSPRDYAAIQCAAALYSRLYVQVNNDNDRVLIAKLAYQMADALEAAR